MPLIHLSLLGIPLLSFAAEPVVTPAPVLTSPSWALRAEFTSAPGIKSAGVDGDSGNYDSGSGSRLGVEAIYTFAGQDKFAWHTGFGIYRVKHIGKLDFDAKSDFLDEAESRGYDLSDYDVHIGIGNIPLKHSVDATAIGGRLGGTLTFNNYYQLEFGVRGLIGQSKMEAEFVDATYSGNSYYFTALYEKYKIKSDTGTYADIDLSVNNVFTLTNGLQFGVEIGYSTWAAKVSFEEVDVTAKGNGLYGGVSVGYRF